LLVPNPDLHSQMQLYPSPPVFIDGVRQASLLQLTFPSGHETLNSFPQNPAMLQILDCEQSASEAHCLFQISRLLGIFVMQESNILGCVTKYDIEFGFIVQSPITPFE